MIIIDNTLKTQLLKCKYTLLSLLARGPKSPGIEHVARIIWRGQSSWALESQRQPTWHDQRHQMKEHQGRTLLHHTQEQLEDTLPHHEARSDQRLGKVWLTQTWLIRTDAVDEDQTDPNHSHLMLHKGHGSREWAMVRGLNHGDGELWGPWSQSNYGIRRRHRVPPKPQRKVMSADNTQATGRDKVRGLSTEHEKIRFAEQLSDGTHSAAL